MAKITLNIANGQIPEIIATLAGLYGNKPDGMADDEWIKSCLRMHLMDMAKHHKRRLKAKKDASDIASEVSAIGGAIT